ncbi:MAG: bifunctional UDP-sugar hydrolase/5'-nucleotidase [Elusimicrobiota bacterium]
MKTTLLSALISLVPALTPAPAAAENIRLTVVHVNDVHGWAMSQPDRKETERQVGGAGALANFVASSRKAGPVLLLDGGDWFQGTPEGTIPRGKMMAEVFNVLRVDASVVGNHEYDIGEDGVKELVAQMNFPVLGSNVYAKGMDRVADYLKPYVVKEIAGVKVGIFGLLTTKMPALSFAENIAGLEFRDEIETAQAMVAELKRQGADIIVLLSHVGYEGSDRHETTLGDQTIAKRVPGIDLIVGSHTHSPIFKPERVNGALIVQAWGYLTHVGEVTLDIDPATKKVVASEGRIVKLWVDQWGEAPEMTAIVRRYQDEIGRRLSEVIGTAEDTLSRNYQKEDPVGRWMTDCMRKWTKTDIAIQNGGGVRGNIQAGPVLLRDMFEIMPFDNRLVTLNMTGAAVLDILDHGVSGNIGWIEVSGVRALYDPAAAKGRRIKQAWVGERKLEPKAVYSVSAPDFAVQGGSGYDFSTGRDKANTSTLIRDVLIWCTRNYSPIRMPADERTVRD